MNTIRRVKIAGLGKSLPRRVVTSAELETRLGLEPGWIERKTGVAERRHATDETAASLGAEAARVALQRAGLTLGDVGLILCASGTPQQTIPCTAVFFQRELGPEAHGIPCFDVNSTCLSFLTGLDVAANAVALGQHRAVLVVSADLASVGLNWNEKESCVLMGDGAAAAVVTRAEETEPSHLYPSSFTTHSAGADLACLTGGGTLNHPNAPTTTPEMNLFHMDGPAIFRFTQQASVPFIAKYLASLPFPAEEIRVLVPHQASLFAVRMAARACGFEQERLVENIQTHGNCISASLPMALHDAVEAGRIRRGDRILLAGTAAGVSIGALAMVY
ncbi:beta-ketoacyl-ACP synthase 3 [Hyalangium gracile]|uniref:beta-ketoacyl-ACP synthase 3 n=1 Tax=Hyalangium gracile TaxID=394092 RepID=UPI001CCB76E3|nr:beta-ketoacyl-ACP synthase 3 [Hyalangium gracile]